MIPLVVIKSCQKFSLRRQAQLETWLPTLDWADFVFLIGGPKPAQTPNDTLWCDVSDAFENIAPKILTACMYALDTGVTNMLVCDDDTYIHTGRLRKSGFEKVDYCGHMRTDNLRYNDNVPYAQGSAYWLSERAMEQAIYNGAKLGNGVIDDGAMGKALLGRVPFIHDRRYYPGPVAADNIPAAHNDTITTHKCLPAEMRRVHELVTAQGKMGQL